jgi:1-acyl-sn-glycerol-3-phosphate acyltransferase
MNLVPAKEGTTPYRVTKWVLDLPFRAAYDIDVVDSWRVPQTGRAIIAANHRSFIDSIFLAVTVPRPVSFLAKAEYFERRRTAWFFKAMGQIPVRRGDPRGAKSALRDALDVLGADGLIGIYPEGTRSRDGLLHRGNLGAARLALLARAPIIPVGLRGTAEVQPIGRRVPAPNKRVEVRFGAPIYPDLTVPLRRQLSVLTRRLMADLAALSGQPTADGVTESYRELARA